MSRLQVAAPGAVLDEPDQPIEVAALLKGDTCETAFAELVRQHATSGGVLRGTEVPQRAAGIDTPLQHSKRPAWSHA